MLLCCNSPLQPNAAFSVPSKSFFNILMFDILSGSKQLARLPNRGDLNIHPIVVVFQRGRQSFKKKTEKTHTQIAFYDSATSPWIRFLTQFECCCFFFPPLRFTARQSVSGRAVLYDLLLTDVFFSAAAGPQIRCRNISEEVKGLCSRVALFVFLRT